MVRLMLLICTALIKFSYNLHVHGENCNFLSFNVVIVHKDLEASGGSHG